MLEYADLDSWVSCRLLGGSTPAHESTMAHAQSTLSSYTSPRPDIVRLVPPAAHRILDIGCSNGAFGAALRARGQQVWGIEQDEGFAASAADSLDHVLQGDAATMLAGIEEETFDVVVCADVLEHIVDPGKVLAGIQRVLRGGGCVVVSLPNVRFYTTFTSLAIRGRWPRNDRGVHDRTHVAWFTDRDARELFERHGFRVDDFRTTYRLSDRPDRRRNALARLVAIGPLRGFLAYQHLYVLRRL